MRKPTALALVLVACLATGCGGGGTSTSVKGLTVPEQAGGDVEVSFTTTDESSRPMNVHFEYSTDDGTTWQTGTVKSGQLTNLASSPDGVRHMLVWDSLADVGFRTEDVTIRVRQTLAPTVEASTLAVELQSLGTAADRVEAHMIHLGTYDAATIAKAEAHDLVVLDPADVSITRAVIAEIQNGVDANDPTDDVIVLGYLFVGEDIRTIGRTDGDLLLDSRFVGNGTGPRVDPRGPDADGQSVTPLALLGEASTSGGYGSWYLDDNSVDNDGIGDGKPDRNPVTGACFVNAGDPVWFQTLDTSLVDGVGIAGIREMLTLDYGRGFGCDGVFLSGMDTCAPNAFTDSGSPVQTEFEWTAAGFAQFVATLRTTYPTNVIAQNRGLFFFDPSQPHFQATTRANVDFVVFESFRLNRSSTETFNPYFFADNKFNVAPRLQAEAYRDDGFQVLSLGYAEGPGIDTNTLLGLSTTGLATLLTDITETQNVVGYRHYLTNATGTLVNTFCRDNADFTDTTPPVWTSTFNVSPGFPTPPTAPTPRIGVQQLLPMHEAMMLRWDVALDLNPVRYVVYYKQGTTMDFAGDTPLDTVRVRVSPRAGTGYEFGAKADTHPYETVITGLQRDRDYAFCIRAIDSVGNEDTNQVVLTARTAVEAVRIDINGGFGDWVKVPLAHQDPRNDVGTSSGPDWTDIKIVNDETNLYIYFASDDRFNLDGSPDYTYSRMLIFIDVDEDQTTGWGFNAVGSELMVSDTSLYRQKNGVFNDGKLQTLRINPETKIKWCEMAIPLSRLDTARSGKTSKIRLVFINDEVWDIAPDTGYIEYEIVR